MMANETSREINLNNRGGNILPGSIGGQINKEGCVIRPWMKVSCVIAIIAVIAAAIAIGCTYTSGTSSPQMQLTTPLDCPKAVKYAGLEVPSRFWGSYRPGIYFGMKTRIPANILTGLMWMTPSGAKPDSMGLRHSCDTADRLATYGWVQHDGENFGLQYIHDGNINMTTSFVKYNISNSHFGGSWTSRVRVEALNKSEAVPDTLSLFYYVGFDDNGQGHLRPNFYDSEHPMRMTSVNGRTQALGDNWNLYFVINDTQMKNVKNFFHSAIKGQPGPVNFKDNLLRELRLYRPPCNSLNNETKQNEDCDEAVIGLNTDFVTPDEPNFIALQINVQLPFEFDIAFVSSDDNPGDWLVGKSYSNALAKWRSDFNSRFEETFHLREKGFNNDEQLFGQAALSNMVGGIGYFYGHSYVKSKYVQDPVLYWDTPLYTGVPSRSGFPRGFLWDEGFHNLLISKWSPEISADIIAHWLDLLNMEGWIPREQALGSEGEANIPPEFLVQDNEIANPPTLLLALKSLTEQISKDKSIPEWYGNYLHRLWPRLEAWYKWFETSQSGTLKGTFRWRGRDATTNKQLNPKTFASGFDDFPRSSHPTEDERHLDLRCWMAMASDLIADIAHIIGKQHEEDTYREKAKFLSDSKLLDMHHWSEQDQAHLDYGLHTENVTLVDSPEGKIRKVLVPPKRRFVPQFGFVALFPFILEILPLNSTKLATLLPNLEDPDILYTPYGLRSLSKSASLYSKFNSATDGPYWRQPVWININFLAVRALNNYIQKKPPQPDLLLRMRKIYKKLRKNVVDNVVKNYLDTGYIWEHYNDISGHGEGNRPFTGWTATTLLMMAEIY